MADLLQFPLPFAAAATDPDAEDDLGDTLSLPDSAARTAALDIHRSWVVEAPAGSGKTGLLIQRYLKLLAGGDIQRPGEVLGITFTRKAAGELRARVLEQLAAAAGNEPLRAQAGDYARTTRELADAVLVRDRALGWRLLENPQQLNLRTIDSFCGELTSRLPLLSGGAGRLRPVEDASTLYLEAARRTLGALGGPDPDLSSDLRCVLLHRDGRVDDCARLLADMLGNREQWGELIPLEREELDEAVLDQIVRARLERTLERIACRALVRAEEAIGPELLGELARFASRVARESSHDGESASIGLCAACPLPPGTSAKDLAHWLALLSLLLTKQGGWRSGRGSFGFAMERRDRDRLRELLAQLSLREEQRPELRSSLCALRSLPPVRYPQDQWQVAKALFRVLRQALLELNILFAERGACDFIAPAVTARFLLRSEAAQLTLRHAPGAQLTHLLVDEMQDTSNGQYELLELLTQGWDGRTQTVFLVGDPKQSIYEFRQARVERFLRMQTGRRFGALPVGALRLTANFRSQRHLVDRFNETFSEVLPSLAEVARGSASPFEVPFVAATPTRPDGNAPALYWHVRFETASQAGPEADDAGGSPTDEEDQHGPAVEDEARRLRDTIEDFLARRRRIGDHESRPPRVAVLARSRSHFAPILSEFQRDRGRGPLPFHAVAVEVLKDRPEILDLLALTRALLHPADRIAWLALLRAPVCGLGAADLLTLVGQGPQAEPLATVAHLVAARAPLLSAEGQGLLRRAWSVLEPALAGLGYTALSTHVERTWRSLGADVLLRAEQKTNARRFLRLLSELEAGAEPLSLALLNRRLEKLYAESSAEPASVELMTIHKAKGLEWDLVLVPGLERGTGDNQQELLKWLELEDAEGGEAEVILAPIQGKGEESSQLSRWLGGLQRSREHQEAKRLFYVACTRAREELHLFAHCGVKANGELQTPRSKSSLLHAAWGAAEPVLRRLMEAIDAAEEGNTGPPPEGEPRPRVIAMPEPQAPTLALAASAGGEGAELAAAGPPRLATLYRLPEGFDPRLRLSPGRGARLPYPPASALRHEAPFVRPEGTFTARAFGNVVHRFLELCADRLSGELVPEELISELPRWRPRLLTAFRSEGLSASVGLRHADRTLGLLEATLSTPEGRWLLGPHPGARSERSLQVDDGLSPEGTPVRNLRADRVFFAGAKPMAGADRSHLWIVDFKTTEPGGRSREAFLLEERAKYLPQMQTYARAMAAAGYAEGLITLALFYPALPHLLYWPFEPLAASQEEGSSTDTVPG